MRLPTTRVPKTVNDAAIAPALSSAASRFVLAALTSASLLTSPLPAVAAPTLNEAIVEVSETSYPIIKALREETFVPFSEKAGGLLLDIKPEKLGRSIGLGIDVLVSAPPEKLDTFKGVVKDAFSGLDPASCTLVPLPSKALADKFQAVAAEQVAADKLKAFGDAYGPALKSLAKTDGNTAICLPPVETLDKLALAQAELARSFGADESTRFAQYTTPVLKSSITLGKVLPLVNDAKKLTPTATPKEAAAFQQAGKRVEAASAAEAQRVKLEALKAKSAAIEAARAAGKPLPQSAAAPARSANPELQAEMAAAREKAAAEAKAKKEAALAEAAARQQALKEAEAQRIAELKAKAAAIQAAKDAAK